MENYLKTLGSRELELRACLTEQNSTPYARRQALEAVDTIIKLVQGYTLAIGHLSGDPSRTDYYREFYDQARSAQGLTKTKEEARE